MIQGRVKRNTGQARQTIWAGLKVRSTSSRPMSLDTRPGQGGGEKKIGI